MKKLLLATAAASMVAGPVAAQGIDFSGYARFGFIYSEGATGGFNNDEVSTTSRFRLNMSASTETDFGATLSVIARAQADGGGATSFNAPRFTVSGGGLSVAVGNICGALECMPGMYFGSRSAGLGVSGLGFHGMAANVSQGNPGAGFFAWDAYSSNAAGAAANNGIELTYSFGDFSAHLSYSDRNPTAGTPATIVPLPPVLGGPVVVDPGTPGTARRERIAGHVAYTFDNFTYAIGFQDSDVAFEDKVIITVGGSFDAFRVNFQASDTRGIKKMVLAGSYDITPEATVLGFIGDESQNRAGFTQFNGTVAGVGLSYALGGGASIETGVVRTSDSNVLADFGMFFSF